MRFLLAALLVGAPGLGACDDGDGAGDRAAFCRSYDELRSEDPFERLTVASPGEMQSAFERLRQGAAELTGSAPDQAAVQAERYAAAIDDLVDQLRGAGYDLRALDLPEYRQATDAYDDAAVSLENAAAATCD